MTWRTRGWIGWRGTAAAVGILVAQGALAIEFEAERVQGILNLDLSLGTAYRVEERDDRLIGLGNGGASTSANADDGDLNYDEGAISRMVRGTAELIVVHETWGAYARGVAAHDWLQSDRLDRTALSSDAEAGLGNGAELREHYLAASFTPRGTPLYFRLGDQVLSWNETTFIRDGLDLVSPVDLATAAQPASSSADSRLPQGMFWLAMSPSEWLAIEGYYQYEWKPAALPPIGGYFSPVDLVGGDRVGVAQMDGRYSDQGTDLDAAFALPPGTLGVDDRFSQLPGRGRDRPADDGQWGMSVVARFLDGLATKVGLHYVRYHSRLPIVSAVTGDEAAVSKTAAANVEQRATELAPIYESTGLDAATASMQARATSEALSLSEYINAAGMFVEYPEDIDSFGASLSFSLVRTGTLVAAEVSRHLDAPLQLAVPTVLNAALSPVLFDSTIGVTPFGELGANERISGFVRRDRTQGVLGITQVLGPRARANQVIVDLSAAWVGIDDMPGSAEPSLGRGVSRNSWGYRVAAFANYASVFGGINVTPRIVWGRDVRGTTPGPTSAFLEGRRFTAVGINADYLLRFEVDLAYTRFSGAGADNTLRDRDYVAMRLTYAF